MKLNKYLILSFVFFVLVFTFHYFEIFIFFERYSYFSDSENYYKASSNFPPDRYDGYYFVYFLSFLRHIASYKIALIILSLIYCGSLLVLFKKFKLEEFNLLFLFHPFIIFIFARGLKETLIMILFLLFMRIHSVEKSLSIRNGIVIIIFSLIFEELKPMGLYFIPFGLTLTYVLAKFFTSKSIFNFGLVFLFISPLLRNTVVDLIPNLKDQLDALVLSGYAVEYTNNFVKPLVAFVFGPGPLKAFYSFFYPTYEFGTFMTSFSLLLGSCFSIVVAIFTFKRIKSLPNSKWNSFILVITILHVFSYILIQDGSVDTRQRGLMFFYLGLIRWK